MKPLKRKSLFLITGGIVIVCVILLILPFFWKQPVFLLLKSNLLNGYGKARLITLYKPAPPNIIREHVDLLTTDLNPLIFRQVPSMCPEKDITIQIRWDFF